MLDAVELHVDVPGNLVYEVLKRLFVLDINPTERLSDGVRLRFLIYSRPHSNDLDVFASVEDLEVYARLEGHIDLRKH